MTKAPIEIFAAGIAGEILLRPCAQGPLASWLARRRSNGAAQEPEPAPPQPPPEVPPAPGPAPAEPPFEVPPEVPPEITPPPDQPPLEIPEPGASLSGSGASQRERRGLALSHVKVARSGRCHNQGVTRRR